MRSDPSRDGGQCKLARQRTKIGRWDDPVKDASNTTAVTLSRLVVGVTGGIAAYKTAELVRLLVKDGVQVDVVMTPAAERFVGAMTFQALSGRPVLTDLWASGVDNAMGHIAV